MTKPSTSYSRRRPTVEVMRLSAQKSVKIHLLHKTPVNNEIHPMPCMGYSRLVWDSQPSKWSSWCSWLSRQSNTLKVLGSNPGEDILFCFSRRRFGTIGRRARRLRTFPRLLASIRRAWRRRRARFQAPIAGFLPSAEFPCFLSLVAFNKIFPF